MGAAQGSGSCQCCWSFSLILRSAGVSSTGAGFSSFSSSMRSDPRAFLRMAALAAPSRRRCVRVRRLRGCRAEGVSSFELLVSSWDPSSGSGLGAGYPHPDARGRALPWRRSGDGFPPRIEYGAGSPRGQAPGELGLSWPHGERDGFPPPRERRFGRAQHERRRTLPRRLPALRQAQGERRRAFYWGRIRAARRGRCVL